MNLERILEEIVKRHLPDDQYFLTEITAKPAGPKTKISIFLDGDNGIDISVCAEVSRNVGRELDELDLLGHSYTLMVSSPGLDRPLQQPRQYYKNLGKSVKIKLTNQEYKQGKLCKVMDDSVVIEALSKEPGDNSEERITFNEIETTHVLVTF